MDPGWRVSGNEEGRDLRKTVWSWDWRGTVSQPNVVLWDMETRSEATHMLQLSRSNVVGEEQGIAVSYTK